MNNDTDYPVEAEREYEKRMNKMNSEITVRQWFYKNIMNTIMFTRNIKYNDTRTIRQKA